MPSWVQYVDNDTTYELEYIIKEVAKVTGRYTKTECVADLIKIATENKNEFVRRILEKKEVKVNGHNGDVVDGRERERVQK